MSRAKYSDEFKAQVVREVIEKDRTIASVAASYELAPQTVGIWVAKYKKEHGSAGSAEEREAATEAVEAARLKKQVRELQQGCELLEESGGLAGASRSVVVIPVVPGSSWLGLVACAGGVGIVGSVFVDQDSQGVSPRCPRTSLPCPC
ncbi:transposase [Actinomyces capricornis]|uniref:Transposase n=1 Tax=Actinomyces capricornis TaxID=2755559 RepID=A0ABM7UGG8_9ACTO|nr:transposase [Actinomyces capricornis]BDA63855.1 hypothetical protein MANAM107_06890 [Actinomyces capricornis]